MSKLKILQTPISSWKYVGMMDWLPQHSKTTSFLMAEIELVLVNGLDMAPFYEQITRQVNQMSDLRGRNQENDESLRNITVPGSIIAKILDDGYE